MATSIYLGNPPENIKKWIIDNYVEPESPSIPEDYNGPVCFMANNPGEGATVQMKLTPIEEFDQEFDIIANFQYSTDNMTTWNKWTGSPVNLDQCSDNKMYLRADPENPNTNGFFVRDYVEGPPFLHQFKISGSVASGGNIQYLLTSEGNETSVPDHAFIGMFKNCNTLTQVPNLLATTDNDSCYEMMFEGCTSLVKGPKISLLSATSVSSLGDMFSGCSKLNYLEVDFIDWWASEDSASPSWLYNVSATGTFVCPKELDESNGETRGPHAIPEGWTIIIK